MPALASRPSAKGGAPRRYLRWTALGACALSASCTPDTNLIDEGTGGAGGPTVPGAGAASLVDPAAGTAGVPLNLAAVLVRFPRPVLVPDGALAIAASGQRTTASAPVPADCPDGEGGGRCFRVGLIDLLLPSSTYLVSLGDGVVGADGAAVLPGVVGQFVTAAVSDLQAPAISGLTVEPSGPCVRVALQTDEACAVSIVLRGDGVERAISGGAGITQFSVAASMAAFSPGTELEVLARATDLAGNVAETAGVAVTVPEGLLPLAITEVLANAAGPEPAQEFVEVRNLGGEVIDIGGLSIEDAKGADVLPPLLLDAAAYALIVPSGFDPGSGADVAPRGGTPLIRVDARIGSDGMTNGGEVVRLRTPAGTIVSSYGGTVDASATKWAGKSVHRIPEDACDQPASWTRLPSEATPGWAAP
jgi:hypothetical protein